MIRKQKQDFAYLSTAEAAKFLDVTPGRVRQLLMRKQLSGHRIGKRGWAISLAELERRKNTR